MKTIYHATNPRLAEALPAIDHQTQRAKRLTRLRQNPRGIGSADAYYCVLHPIKSAVRISGCSEGNSLSFSDVAYGADGWIASGLFVGPIPANLTSSNGIDWKWGDIALYNTDPPFYPAPPGIFSRVTFGGGMWVALANYYYSSIWTSTDGKRFTLRNFDRPNYDFYTAAYGNGHWIVAGDGGRMLRLGPVIHLRSLEKRPDGEVRFAVSGPVGSSYRLQTSPDLQEWNNLMTILATNETMHASDRSTSILQQRYYRIVSP